MIRHFTVGICAYNEEENITRSIKSAYSQITNNNFRLKEVLVIASGCTDSTLVIVKKLIHIFPTLRLIEEKDRLGKASAVNKIIKFAKSRIIILQGADVVPAKNCFNLLLAHTKNKEVGMVGGKIVPQDDINTFLGYANHLKWKLHHDINVKYPERPKLGELIVFKKIFLRIPPKTAVDEASIEPLVKLQGYKTVYESEAIIYNTGPKTLREYLSQRRRIFAGHYETKVKYGYEVITFGTFSTIPIFLSSLKMSLKDFILSFMVAGLEIIARFAGYSDIKFKLRNHTIWKSITTSKNITFPKP